MMTNDEARQYFDDKGLTYSDITSGDICCLIMILNKHIKRACKNHEMSDDTIHLSQKIDARYKTNGNLLCSYIRLNSREWRKRECISFNYDGFIGFAGWAASRDTKPIIEAFIEWCDMMDKFRPIEPDEIRLLKNYLSNMPKVYGLRNQNWVVVRDLLMSGTSTSGMTSSIAKCRELGIDPYGHNLEGAVKDE
jgi:hypothetical protein